LESWFRDFAYVTDLLIKLTPDVIRNTITSVYSN